MFNISKYLEKFTKNLNNKDYLNTNIILVFKEITNIVLDTNDFEIKNNVLILKTSPGVKNKVFIFKNDLLKKINSISNIKILDIK